jgi:hypothetical protein
MITLYLRLHTGLCDGTAAGEKSVEKTIILHTNTRQKLISKGKSRLLTYHEGTERW